MGEIQPKELPEISSRHTLELSKVEKKEVTVLTVEEQKKLLKAASSERIG